MIFNKSEQKNTTPCNICILGSSATSLYIAHILQSYEHHVTIICPPAEADELNATDIIIKNPHKLQNQRHNFNFSHELTFKPQLLIIASNIINLRRDLLLISPSLLKESDIINLTPCLPVNFISETFKLPIINAYYEGWLTKHKNTITLQSKKHNLAISLPSGNNILQERLFSYFPSSIIDLKFTTQDTQNFWNWLAPNILVYLHEMISERPISTQIKTLINKQNLNTCLQELSIIADISNVTINKNEILASVYNLNECIYFSSFSSNNDKHLLFERMTSLLFSDTTPNKERYPYLHKVFKQISNKL